jgi:uncharacterized membrane protein
LPHHLFGLTLFILSGLLFIQNTRTCVFEFLLYKNRLLIAGVLTGLLLAGPGNGAMEGLFPGTINYIDEGLPALTKYLHTVLFTVSGTSCLIWICSLVSMFPSIELQSFAVYVYKFILSKFIVYCEGFDALPCIMKFDDLHLTENS